MSFLDELKTVGATVETALDQLISERGAAPKLVEAMRYATLSGGKRLRPFFVVETARMLGGDRQGALRVAAALECVHCFSLTHDDLPGMDNDDLRRGKPTVHKQFDEATAILVGDALLAYAFEIIADPLTHTDPAVRSTLTLKLAQAVGKDGMCAGQMLDMDAATNSVHTLEQVQQLQALKTGALFTFALESAGIISDANDEQMAALRLYAQKVGLAFQITDDILDREGRVEEMGKRVAKDADVGKATSVDVLGLEPARALAHSLADEAITALSIFGERAQSLCEAAHFIVTRTR